MKTSHSDRDFVESVLARTGSLGISGENLAPQLVELAQAYLRLEDRLDKIIAIGDKYQAEAIEAWGRLRDALDRLASYERGGEMAALAVPVDGAAQRVIRASDQILERLRETVERGGEISRDDVRTLLQRFEKMESRLEKIVRIGDGYQRQLREASMRMEYMARTDLLTGLSNRRDMVERLDRELSRYKRYGAPFSVILFDIDNFKQVNDRYGHDVGDKTLRTIAGVFGRELRKTDVCGRWGGEEFLVLCPETGPAEAFLVGEKCRRAIGATEMYSRLGDIRVTLSGGICGVEPGLGIDELIRRADEALYGAKGSGKNKVLLWAPA